MAEDTTHGGNGGSHGRDTGGSRRRDEEEPPVVIRDRRKFDADGNRREPVGEQSPAGPASAGAGPASKGTEAASGGVGPTSAGSDAGPGSTDGLTDDDVNAQAELMDLRTQVSDRTSDLQRLSAEYANYRKRVERDRVLVGEIATGRVIEALLPVLDDVERAAQHGDLTGAFKTVADKLVGILESLGLQAFGEPGDAFDPAVHEAVMHDQSDDVSAPTATSVMRKGYRQGERLLRPAMVGVSEPS
jgi:molecular chaperone GrpE